MGGEVGEGGVDAIGGQDKVDYIVGAALSHAERHLIIRHGQLFIGHPARDFNDLVDVGAHVAGVVNDWMKAVEHRTARQLRPAHRRGAGRTTEPLALACSCHRSNTRHCSEKLTSIWNSHRNWPSITCL